MGHLFDVLPLILDRDRDKWIHEALSGHCLSHFMRLPSLNIHAYNGNACDGAVTLYDIFIDSKVGNFLETTYVDEVGYLHIYSWIDLFCPHMEVIKPLISTKAKHIWIGIFLFFGSQTWSIPQ